MTTLKRFTLAVCLAAAATAPMAVGARAETTTPTAEKPSATSTEKTGTDKMSDADKRAKAADCSKQADAKHLHGSARESFRAACKRK